jgi:ubiquinone/menaquinone biosynthesis C-methylase UbiE
MTRHIPSLTPLLIEEPELARQVQLARCLVEERGAYLLPEPVASATARTALDVTGGAGSWALDLAQAYPHIQVIGIDSSMPCITYARCLAQERDLSSARFFVQAMCCLEGAGNGFSPETFDLMHGAFIAPTLLTMDYPVLLRSLFRLSHPAGIVCWTEMEFPITTSPAFEQLTLLACRALQAAEHSFIPPSFQDLAAIFDEWRQATGHALRTLLDGGHTYDGGAGSERSAPSISSTAPRLSRFQQIRPFPLEQKVITQHACEQLLSQVHKEVQQGPFCGLYFVLSVLGQKTSTGDTAHL